MRASTLQNTNLLAVNREIGSKYDVVLAVKEKLPQIELVAGMDLDALITELENAQDFTGITVVSGTEVAWDAVNKVLTVPRGEQGVKGDNGDKGDIGPQGPQGPRGAQGPQGLKGDIGPKGPRGFNGPKGDTGADGKDGKDLTVTQIVYNSDGTFTWMFSDGTNYTTPNLKGPQGIQGIQGKSSYTVAVENGFVGTEAQWLVSLIGDTGATGNGIASIVKTDTIGLVDTYTVTMTSGATSTFTVTNGVDGLSAYEVAANNGFVGTEAEWLTSLDGIDGRAITTVTFTSTTDASGLPAQSGGTDTYTISYSDATTSTYNIYNGADVTNVSILDDNSITATNMWSSSKINTELGNKQDTLVSGANIKTINGENVLGSGDIVINSGGAVDSVAGKTGVVTLVKGDVGLNNVDNTSDINKPISTATQTALNSKVDKVAGKQLSTEDYTTADKNKLTGLSNYTKPASEPISYITGLQTALDSKVSKTGVEALHSTDALRISGTTLSLYKGDGTFESVVTQDTIYTLPKASATVLGGIKVGTNLSIDANGVLSANDTNVSFSEISNKPTNLSGYGITDAYTKTEVDTMVGNIALALDTINGQVI